MLKKGAVVFAYLMPILMALDCNIHGECVDSVEDDCLQFSNCNTIDESCTTCTSSQSSCGILDPSDCTHFDGCCQGKPIAWAETKSPEHCRQICKNYQDDKCKWFAFAIATELCVLMEECPKVTDQDENRCISGTKEECVLVDDIVLVAFFLNTT